MRNNKFVGSISGQEGAGFSNSVQLAEQNAAQVFNMCIHGECFISVETSLRFLTDSENGISQPEMDIGVRLGMT